MLRSLIHYGRVQLAVVLGAAVGTAVLTGALLVGDSVRGSLRDLTLDRLGRIDLAMSAHRFFRAELAREMAATPGAGEVEMVVPAIVLRGTATHGDTRARATEIAVLGIDEGFAALYPATDPSALGRELTGGR